uniref:Stonustoxin subunit alpha-like n=1 Tax=Astyanax mexicanus TaxID=7994 RepID=W5LDF5_ASTMX
MAEPQTIEIACLGRPFQLGMLYDCRRDALIPGLTLWDSEILKDKISVQNQANTDFKIFASDSTEDKSHALHVSASLEASFLSGLVSVKGSAEFLNNKKKSMKQSRVTLQYRASTHFKQLTMDHLGAGNIKHQNVFEQGFATHVVTAVLYGAQAFFVFDREVSSSEKEQKISGNLQAAIKKIPFISIEGQASLDMTEEENMEANKFSCTFHGDFSLPRNPVTFNDAIQVCADLSTILGKNGENAVPMTVWLFPLVKLDSAAAKLVREISISLVKRCKSVLDELDGFDMRCQDLIKNNVSMKFSEIENKLKKFRDLCSQHKLIFQKILCQLLPVIRGGGKEEEALATALISLEQSPFRSNLINAYLNNRDREINLVESYLKKMEAVDVITSSSELEKLTLDFNNEYVVVFALSSLEQNDKYISDLEEFLYKSSSDETLPYKPDPSSASQQWFNSNEVKALTRQTVQSFLAFYEANRHKENVKFCIASIPDTNTPAASVHVYQDGELLSSQFQLPRKPCDPVITKVEHDCVHLEIKPALHDTNSIESYCILYRKKESSDWTEVVLKANSAQLTINQLEVHSDYQLKFSAICCIGVGPSSEAATFKTPPCSPPGILKLSKAKTHSISVFWTKPITVGKNVNELGYVIEFRENSKGEKDDDWDSVEASDNNFSTVDGLDEDTAYTMRVSAKYGNAEKSLPSEERILRTSPFLEELRYESSKSPKNPFIHFFGCQSRLRKAKDMKDKVIMVVGADDVTNTTVCNLMTNYILGVKWEDNFRIRLVPKFFVYNELFDDIAYAPNRVHSYELHHSPCFQVPFSVTIVDTPGFSSRTASFDDILNTIKRFLQKTSRIDHIDVICFALQHNFDLVYKLIFEQILSIFPENITENLMIFLKSGDQNVLEAIQGAGLSFPKRQDGDHVHFRFNTVPLFQPKQAEDGQMQMEWNSDFQQMKVFFKALEIMESKDLTAIRRVHPEYNGPPLEDFGPGLLDLFE